MTHANCLKLAPLASENWKSVKDKESNKCTLIGFSVSPDIRRRKKSEEEKKQKSQNLLPSHTLPKNKIKAEPRYTEVHKVLVP